MEETSEVIQSPPTPTPAPATVEILSYDCDKCERSFTSIQALRMHKIRMHTRAGRQGAMWARNKSQNKAREARLTKRREYQKELRDRYYAEGRDSKGQLRPKGWKPRKRRQSVIAKKPPGAKWSPARRRKFMETWKLKKATQPQQPTEKQVPQQPKLGTIFYCPNCGYGLQKHLLAAGFNE